MPSLNGVVQQLKKERERIQRDMERLSAALTALGRSRRKLRGTRAHKTRRPMSASARKRIAAAQRARWAKWKAARRKK